MADEKATLGSKVGDKAREIFAGAVDAAFPMFSGLGNSIFGKNAETSSDDKESKDRLNSGGGNEGIIDAIDAVRSQVWLGNIVLRSIYEETVLTNKLLQKFGGGSGGSGGGNGNGNGNVVDDLVEGGLVLNFIKKYVPVLFEAGALAAKSPIGRVAGLVANMPSLDDMPTTSDPEVQAELKRHEITKEKEKKISDINRSESDVSGRLAILEKNDSNATNPAVKAIIEDEIQKLQKEKSELEAQKQKIQMEINEELLKAAKVALGISMEKPITPDVLNRPKVDLKSAEGNVKTPEPDGTIHVPFDASHPGPHFMEQLRNSPEAQKQLEESRHGGGQGYHTHPNNSGSPEKGSPEKGSAATSDNSPHVERTYNPPPIPPNAGPLVADEMKKQGVDDKLVEKVRGGGQLTKEDLASVPPAQLEKFNKEVVSRGFAPLYTDTAKTKETSFEVPKNSEEVIDHLGKMKEKGIISDAECVSLAMASVGIKKGDGQPGSNVQDWVKNGNITADTPAGTPVSTFLGDKRDAKGNIIKGEGIPSEYYAGHDSVGRSGYDKDHAAVLTGNYKYDDKGNITAAEITDQSANNPWHGQKHWITDTGPEGTGGEQNLRNFHPVGTLDAKGNKIPLGGPLRAAGAPATSAAPTLSKEQSEAFQSLQKGPISGDDPRAKHFESLNPTQLKEAGIQKTEHEGHASYSAAPISKEEAASKSFNGGAAATTALGKNQQEAYNAARGEGLSDSGAKILTANMTGESLRDPSNSSGDGGQAQGIVQWHPDRAEAIKNQFGKYPKDMSVAEQTKAAIWEMKTNPDYAKSWDAIKNDSMSDQDRLHTVVKNYERPADTEGAVSTRMQYLSKLKVGGEPVDPKKMTPEQLAQGEKAVTSEREAALAKSLDGQGGSKQAKEQTFGKPDMAFGDSTVNSLGLPGDSKDSRNPRDSLKATRDYLEKNPVGSPGDVKDKNVVVSSLSNDTSKHGQDALREQIQALKDRGAHVNVLGMGSRSDLAAKNPEVEKIAKETGSYFTPMTKTDKVVGGMVGVHADSVPELREALSSSKAPHQANEASSEETKKGTFLEKNDIAGARAYLRETASGNAKANPRYIDDLHPDFALRAADSIKQARAEGISQAGLYSGNREPTAAVGHAAGFDQKGLSLHPIGMAGDYAGIGGPGSESARHMYDINKQNGLFNPYGYQNRNEYNHFQSLPEEGQNTSEEARKALAPYYWDQNRTQARREAMWDAASRAYGVPAHVQNQEADAANATASKPEPATPAPLKSEALNPLKVATTEPQKPELQKPESVAAKLSDKEFAAAADKGHEIATKDAAANFSKAVAERRAAHPEEDISKKKFDDLTKAGLAEEDKEQAEARKTPENRMADSQWINKIAPLPPKRPSEVSKPYHYDPLSGDRTGIPKGSKPESPTAYHHPTGDDVQKNITDNYYRFHKPEVSKPNISSLHNSVNVNKQSQMVASLEKHSRDEKNVGRTPHPAPQVIAHNYNSNANQNKKSEPSKPPQKWPVTPHDHVLKDMFATTSGMAGGRIV